MAVEEALRETVEQGEELQQVVDTAEALLRLLGGGERAQRFGSELIAAAAQRVEDRIDFAPLALTGHQGEHLPDVAQRFVVFFAVALAMHPANEAPFEEL